MVGSCDVEFGNSDDNNGGGGNGGSSDPEIVQGTIVDIIPDADIEGILVIITNEDNTEFSDNTSNSGFFSISSGQGTFSGTPQLEFLDDTTSLGLITITVFPTAELDLGNIILESGTVIFTDTTEVTFKGDVITNNCTGNSGTLEVEATREGDSTDVIVQISASTDILRNGDELLCEDVLIGQSVEVRGELLVGNTVDADIVDLL
jgi:hypothetical protein